MQCLTIEIENDLVHMIANLHIGANILDNPAHVVQCMEVITMEKAKQEDLQDICERNVPCSTIFQYRM